MTAPKRVLFVITSTNRRGAEVEGTEIARGLATRGLHTEVVALAPGQNSHLLEMPVLGSSVRALSTLRALRKKAKEFDLVVAYGSATLPACAIGLLGSGLPFIYRSIGDPGQWVRGRIHRARTGWLMRGAVRVVALWPGAGESITRLYRVPASKVSIIPNARDANYFVLPSPGQRAEARCQLGLNQDETVALVLGSLTEEKCVHVAIEAASLVPGLQLLIAGAGPLSAGLERLATRRMTGRARFLGSVPHVLPLLHAADVMLLTSCTEGMPGALIEAGLCGLPAVATDVGGVGDVVAEMRTGVLIRDGDPRSIATGIQRVVAARLTLGREAREYCAKRYSLSQVLEVWERVITQVAAG